MPSVDYQVSASADDADEVLVVSDRVVSITSAPLRNVDAADEWDGVRFQGVTIPDGATITSAYLTLYFPAPTQDEPDITIYGQDNGNPGQFTTDNANISSRTRTSASVDWGSANLGSSARWVNTSNLSTIVQELVDNYSYASGASMVFVWKSRANDGARDCTVQSYDVSASEAAKLHIEYTESGGGGGSAVPVIMNSYRQRRA